jgi:hypothetical protein
VTQLTSKQWFQIISGINGGLITGAALLQTLFGQDLTLKIVAVLGIIGIIINSVGTTLSGQGSLVKDVAAMPGVEKITVNSQANMALATIAVDPGQSKIAPTPSAQAAVAQTAKNGHG